MHLLMIAMLLFTTRSSLQIHENQILADKKIVNNYFLCRLRSIAAHRDHFVWRLYVCLSGSHTFLVVMHSYVSQETHAFLGKLPLFSSLFCNFTYLFTIHSSLGLNIQFEHEQDCIIKSVRNLHNIVIFSLEYRGI